MYRSKKAFEVLLAIVVQGTLASSNFGAIEGTRTPNFLLDRQAL